jgi:hypothetical protein
MSGDPYQDLFGRPPPFKPTPEIWGKSILETFDLIDKKNNHAHYLVPEDANTIIHLSAFFIEPNEWIAKFTHLRWAVLKFFRKPEACWQTIAHGLYTHEIEEACKKLLPNFDPEKYPNQTITRSSPQKIGPELSTTPNVGAILKKVISKIPKRRFPTVTEYILFHAPSKSYELIYSTTLACCRNKRSAKGKKVYPYGQEYIADLAGKSPRTTRRAWSWLRKRGIFNKAWNENPKEHHCAGWYVCTSMKQVSYFRDPENRHRKTKRQD